MSGCVTNSTTVRFRMSWHPHEHLKTCDFLNEYFERTADWSNSVVDMGLSYVAGKPYTRLVVNGDFYVESGLRIDHFALDCSGAVILIAVDDDGNSSYLILE